MNTIVHFYELGLKGHGSLWTPNPLGGFSCSTSGEGLATTGAIAYFDPQKELALIWLGLFGWLVGWLVGCFVQSANTDHPTFGARWTS